jgi:hypothetical protein
MLNVSDWVLILTSLFLGFSAFAVAIFGPPLADLLKRKVLAPKLTVSFELAPPFCHQTFFGSRADGWPAFFFRFWVLNDGKSLAQTCEAVLDELWIYDEAETPHKVEDFRPVNLRWTGRAPGKLPIRFLDINPQRGYYCDIGHIASPDYQKEIELPGRVRVDLLGSKKGPLRLMLAQIESPFSQPNCLPSGKYAIKVLLYSENAPYQHRPVFFEIVWSGEWRDTEEEMFKQAVVSQVNRP